MKKLLLLTFLLVLEAANSEAQTWLQRNLPTSAVSVQYAGSTGFLSFGYYRQTESRKFEYGLIYGNVPNNFGGPLQSLTLKFSYNPFHLRLSDRFDFDPIQGGIFLTDWIGENLHTSWSARYPKGYYWWQSNLRKHIFLSTDVSYRFHKRKVDRVTLYFEANTNDLYLYDYVPNTSTVSFYDIIFYGVGCKFYFAGGGKRESDGAAKPVTP